MVQRRRKSSPVDPAIEALNLEPRARAAAYALKRKHPFIVFTSGRRAKEDQARAMAQNVVLKPQWIVDTYKDSAICRACQSWVDEHPDCSVKTLATGLLEIFNDAPPEDLLKFSKHLTGQAFDVKPLPDGSQADAVKRSIRTLAGEGNFLEKEGGLVRWHAQFL
jgi:hypothetical protein